MRLPLPQVALGSLYFVLFCYMYCISFFFFLTRVLYLRYIFNLLITFYLNFESSFLRPSQLFHYSNTLFSYYLPNRLLFIRRCYSLIPIQNHLSCKLKTNNT